MGFLRLKGEGAEAVILDCTEIGPLLRPADVAVPLFDRHRSTAEGAALYAMKEEKRA
jgi:aspartate racemase